MEIAEALKRLEKNITENKLIQNGEKLLLGCSGGADSNAMLYLFSRLRVSLNLTLLAVHINHQIRGAESDKDEKSVKELCLKLNIPIIIHRINIPEKGNLENQARKKRMESFNKVLESYKMDKILLAHQRDDQAETVILNLLRGSGINGMAGIKPISGNIVHPLLCFNRKDLEDILKKAGISWRTDSSNQDNKFRRNLLRNEIIPLLEQEFNPELKKHLSQLADFFVQAERIFKQRNKTHFKRLCLDQQPGRIVLDKNSLLKLNKIERYYLLRDVFQQVCACDGDFFAVHFQAIENILSAPGSKILSLPHKITVIKQYEELLVQIESEKETPNIEPLLIDADRTLAVYGNYRFTFKYLRILPKEQKIGGSEEQVILDADKVKSPFYIRFRKPGDKFIPFGMTQLK
ncbi:MAG TPA: tRNA lysidine(34) synthetase TilS, partial [Candidatus Cloacimonas sp.]|nr:tRNA lysidine(34) synthetase TilS [Candidatus Cloacimonas sp.]